MLFCNHFLDAIFIYKCILGGDDMGDLYFIALGIFGLIFAIAPQKVVKQSIINKSSSLMFFRIIGVILVIINILALVI